MTWIAALGTKKTDEEIAGRRDEVAKKWGIAEFSCDHCSATKTCDYAFDPYNIGGDCLAEK